MTPFRIFLLGLALLAGLLFLLNPGPEAFKEFVQNEMAARAEAEARGAAGDGLAGDVGGFLAQRLGRRAGDLASDAFTRDNYYVASIYRLDMNGRRPGGEWEFLGIAGAFFPIETPEILEEL